MPVLPLFRSAGTTLHPTRVLMALCAVVLLWSGPVAADGQSPTVPLRVDLANGVSGCPPLAEIEAAIQARLVEAEESVAPTEFRVRLERRDGKFVATLSLHTPEGPLAERTLVGSRCASLVHATGLAVALMLPQHAPAPAPVHGHEPTAESETASPKEGSTERVIPATESEAIGKSRGPTKGSSRRWPPLSVRALVGASVGRLPTTTEALGAGLDLHLGARSLALVMTWHREATTPLADGFLAASMASASVHGCQGLGPVGACLVGEAGLLSSEGRGHQMDASALSPVASLGLGSYWERALGERVALRASLEASLTIVRPRLVVSGDPGGEWIMPRAQGLASLSISHRLW